MPGYFKISTLGCKVNQYESAYLKERLCQAGWREARGNEKCGVIIVNTCIVTGTSAGQSRQEIRKAIRENPEALVAATGCYAQHLPDEIRGIEGLAVVWGNTNKEALPGYLLDNAEAGRAVTAVAEFRKDEGFELLPIKRFLGRSRAFLKIQDGCRSFCSYCVVPFSRGPLRSLEPSKVMEMIETLCKSGHREIVLTGIHLGRYGTDIRGSLNLKGLLREIVKEGFAARIRLSSLEPNEIDLELIDIVASEQQMCRHFHIPLQSGDDRVLMRMNRDYSAMDFAALVERIHESLPRAAIGVDIMSGFPGEDAAAHENTISLVRDLPVSYLHVFPFSPRPGTPAAEFKGRVASVTAKQRSAELRQIGLRKKDRFYKSCLGRNYCVLSQGSDGEVDVTARGISDNYLRFHFCQPPGSGNMFVLVTAERMEKGLIKGAAVSVEDRPGIRESALAAV